MTTYRFIESAQCRVLLKAVKLMREEAQAMHLERVRALQAEGWEITHALNIEPYLRHEGRETGIGKDEQHRILRWEEET